MKQIISLHVGQGGVQLGSSCWELFCLEHGITPNGAKPIPNDVPSASYFSQTQAGKYVPRAIHIDLEPDAIDNILLSPFRQLYCPQNIISGKEDTGSNFARGYYEAGKQPIDFCMDKIRKEVDKCENFQGFLMYSSLGGGTGAGLGTVLLEKLSSEYQKSKKMSFNIYPSAPTATSSVQPYNYALSTYFRRKHENVAVVLDNSALHTICKKGLEIYRPNYTNMNQLTAMAISAFTSSTRFDGSLNIDLAEFESNLVPFPRFHYMATSLAPINNKETRSLENSSLIEITNNLFQPANQFARIDPRQGKFMACTMTYRGDIVPKDVCPGICSIKTKRTIQFVDWCPNGFKVGLTYQPNKSFPNGYIAEEKRSICMLANTTAISTVFERLDYKFNIMLKKKAFTHWFVSNGLEEAVFDEVKEDLASLEKDYKEAEQQATDQQG